MKKFLSIFTVMMLLLTAAFSSCSHTEPITTSEPPLPAPDGILTVIFSDVGKADFMLLSCGGEYMIIDSGYKKSKDRIFELLDSLGVKEISAAVATHADKDHIGSMAAIIEKYKVKTLYLSGMGDNSKLYTDMLNAAAEKNTSVTELIKGDSFLFVDAVFDVLSPNTALLALGDVNEASLVLSMRYGEKRVLFMGDAQLVAENELISDPDIDLTADIIKIGHHGSEQASTRAFLSRTGAKYAVISTAKTKSDDYPAQSTLDSIAQYNMEILRTDINGDITMTTDGKTISFSVIKSNGDTTE